MATIFISHSSKDDKLASDIEAWLRANGFTDLFIDHSEISTGERWADALRSSAGSCRIVVCLVTERWLASAECPSEFRAAWYMGKRIAPLFLIDDESTLPESSAATLARVRAESQGLELAPFYTQAGHLDFSRDEARADLFRKGLRAAGALSAVGLDPDVFEIDRIVRPGPFPGLSAFGDEDADAALFFGRSREIADTLEELRAMRATSDRRVLMIIGASGAGKSSLLKAGIIPRLRRDAPAWIPLRSFRPGADPLLNFAEAITRTLADFGQVEAHGALRHRLLESWRRNNPQEALAAQAVRLRTAAGRPEGTILIGVDQAEELAHSSGESAEALAVYLRAAMDADNSWRLAFTLRTDSFAELQAHPRFEQLEARGYDLRALPTFRFEDVVTQPAKRYGVDIAPELVDQLMEDAPSKDALPLLAFAMQRLWDQFGAQQQLGLADYNAMGGLAGLIEDAAERALCGVEPEQADSVLMKSGATKAQDDIGARTFVPPLADINDEGAAVRRVAAWTEFDEEQKALLDRFDRWRLVVKKGDAGTVEVAHEALFREWPRLSSWLEPERARLEALRELQISAAAWSRNQRQRSFAAHTGRRLDAVRRLQEMPRYRDQIGAADAAYIEACRATAMRRTWSLVGAVLAVPALAGAGWITYIGGMSMRSGWLQSQAQPLYSANAFSSQALADAAAGFEFQDCEENSSRCPVMVILPGGHFTMGSEESDIDASGNEFPKRDMTVGRFAVSKFEITWDEWQACLAAGGCNNHTPDDSGFGRGRKPVVNVSWNHAQSYVGWLSRMTGQDYRLLSEAEWEYAARGVTTSGVDSTSYPWGDEPPVCKRGALNGANYSRCEPQETQEVGLYAPNAFGLYDMSGNIWEWVQDCYASYDETRTDASPVEQDAGSCAKGILRSGAWIDSRMDLRSGYRLEYERAKFLNVFGFRVARTI